MGIITEPPAWSLLLIVLVLAAPSAHAAGLQDRTSHGLVEELTRMRTFSHVEEHTQTHRCSGSAPLLAACSTGTHEATGVFLGLGLSAVNYHGILENRVDWLGGYAYLRCTIDGASGTCTFDGEVPPAGVRLVHTCRSMDPATGLPGGQGSFQCVFQQ